MDARAAVFASGHGWIGGVRLLTQPPRTGGGGRSAAGSRYCSAKPSPAPRRVPIAAIRTAAFQPRRTFVEDEIETLARSIREQGLLQPLLVRPLGTGEAGFELVAGERRWRAAQRIGLHEVPVVIRALGDAEAIQLALVENLQREDRSALEEAAAHRRLIDAFGRTQTQLAEAVGKSRSHVANTLRLLSLPPEVRRRLDDGSLSAGHGRALLGATDPERLAAEVVRRGLNVRATDPERLAAEVVRRGLNVRATDPERLAAEVVRRGLNVRATERLVQRRAAAQGRPPRRVRDADTAALERDLGADLGLRVTLDRRQRGGAVTVHYRSVDQLDRLLRLLRAG